MKENNKMIAEFMKVFPREGEKRTHMKEWYSPIDLDFVGLPDELTLAEDLDFNQWHWLMPVVDKIEAIHGVYRKGGLTNGGQMHNAKDTKYLMEYGRYNKSIAHIYAQDRLSAEYKAVVEFINNQNK